MSNPGAPIDNKNAEKWTLEKSAELFDKADSIVKRKAEYLVHGVKIQAYEFDFIGELADELEVYRDLLQRDIPNKFPEFTARFNRLKNKLETNCYSNSKKGIINTAVGIVNLKSNHGWTDKQQVDHTTNGKDLNINPIQWIKTEDKD